MSFGPAPAGERTNSGSSADSDRRSRFDRKSIRFGVPESHQCRLLARRGSRLQRLEQTDACCDKWLDVEHFAATGTTSLDRSTDANPLPAFASERHSHQEQQRRNKRHPMRLIEDQVYPDALPALLVVDVDATITRGKEEVPAESLDNDRSDLRAASVALVFWPKVLHEFAHIDDGNLLFSSACTQRNTPSLKMALCVLDLPTQIRSFAGTSVVTAIRRHGRAVTSCA